VLNLDAKDASSYPGTGTKWTDLVAGTEFTFSSAPTYNASTGFFNFASNQATGTTSINPTRGAVEMWFRWRDNSPLAVTVLLTGAFNWLSLGDVTGNPINDESLEFWTGTSACMDYRRGHTFLRDGQWHQAVAVIDGVANKLYIDGVEIVNDPIPPGSPTYFRTGSVSSIGLMNLANVYIGSYSTGYQFDGDIAILRVYDTGAGSFSASDVAQNYAANSGRFFGSFHPGQLSKLTLWFDASDASTLTLSGTDVDQIQDKALYVADGKLVPVSTNKPSIVTEDGREWMSFDGASSDWMKAQTGASLLSYADVRDGNSFETYVVARVVSAPNATASPNGAQIMGDDGGYIGFNTRTGLSGGKVRVSPWVWSNGMADAEASVDVSTSHVYGSSMVGGSGTQSYYVDSATTTVSGATDIGGGSTIQVGRAYNSSYSTVLVGEICFFETPLTASERSNLMAYFQAKWGTP
tara:strand:- start:236 stop:1630 length:1395 start_codon:yes stop_codon:yes gene_type:complete